MFANPPDRTGCTSEFAARLCSKLPGRLESMRRWALVPCSEAPNDVTEG